MIGFFVIQSLVILRSVKSVHADGLKLTFFFLIGADSLKLIQPY